MKCLPTVSILFIFHLLQVQRVTGAWLNMLLTKRHRHGPQHPDQNALPLGLGYHLNSKVFLLIIIFFIVTQIRETLTSTAIKTNTADLGLAVNPSRWPPSTALTPLPGLCCTHTHLWKSHSSRWILLLHVVDVSLDPEQKMISCLCHQVWNSIQFYL